MDRDAALARTREIEAEMARLHAEQDRLLVRIAGSAPVVEELWVTDRSSDSRSDRERRIRIADAAREEIAAYLRWSPSYAQSRIDEARLLAGPLARTGADLAAGLISPQQVAAIAEAARRLPGRLSAASDPAAEAALEFTEACARLEHRVLPVARRATLTRTRAAARRAVLSLDPDGHARRRRQALATRDVWICSEDDGVATLLARLSSEHAHAILTAVSAQSCATRMRAEADSGLTAGEQRAAALLDLVLRPEPTGRPSIPVRLDITVPFDTLLGLGHEPARLDGEPVSVDVIRDLLADPAAAVTWRRLVTDPVTGHLLDVGRRSYVLPDRLREYIVMRDITCRFPGCSRRARASQIDHALAWDADGPTDVANLGALCTRHHQLKTHARWDITVSSVDGSCTWRSPAGHIYHHPPPE